jgi:signal transduction histidine kinase/CheY-like chemotaxis protein/ligand-binding sensor domain-containing protein
MKPVFFFILAACFPVKAQAQVQMTALGVEEGLSQGFITSMIQDKQGFIWLGTYDGLNRYDGYSVRRFTTKPFDPWSLQASFVTKLYEDEHQLLWVGTHQGLQVFDPLTERFYNLSRPKYNLPANHVGQLTGDGRGNIFVHIPSEKSSTGVFRISTPPDLVQQLRGQNQLPKNIQVEPVGAPASVLQPCTLFEVIGDSMILMYDANAHLFRYSEATKSFKSEKLNDLPHSSTDHHNILWGKHYGYFFRWKLPNGKDSIVQNGQWHLAIRLHDEHIALWLFDHGPLFRKNTRMPIDFALPMERDKLLGTPAFRQNFTVLIDHDRLWNNNMLVDRSGMLWLATGGWGLRKINPNQLAFKGFLAGKSVSSIRELPGGQLWVRLYSDESFVMDANTGNMVPSPWGYDQWLHEVFVDSRQNYWLVKPNVAPHDQKRLMRYDKRSGATTHFEVNVPFVNSVPEKILEDKRSNVWIAMHQGELYRCRPNTSDLQLFSYARYADNNPESLRTTAIAEDQNGAIWVGTNRGLLRITEANTSLPQFKFFKHDARDPQTMSIDWVTSVCPDPKNPNILWIGTRGGGLNRLNTLDDTFTYITETPSGLPDNVVYGILPDENGNLWCSTNRGICRFNPIQNTFATYQKSEGLLNTEFNTNAFLHTKDGRFWFGGVGGLNVFRPEEIHSNPLPPNVAITGIKVRGIARLPDSEGKLTLPFSENNVNFEFAAFDYVNPATNRFRHRLLGIDKNWVNDGTAHNANYAALPPGKYVFELQGATADSPWSVEPVVFQLIILPPWYRTGFAWIVYGLALLAAIWGVIRYREKMFRLEQTAETNQRESTRLKAFEVVKNQFFANLAHELRTPLTVILGLTTRLQNKVKQPELEENVRNIAAQGNMLLELTNQILDLAKLESQQFVLNCFNGNISQFVQRQVEALTPLAESKNLQLIVQNEQPVIWMDFDPVQIQKILNNLISNAIRHSSPGGNIRILTTLQDHNQWLRLTVEDEGEGIAPDDLPHIFKRFYQASQSEYTTGASGLGLTLTRDLVRLMGGEIKVSSTQGEGARFTILLPIKNQSAQMEEQPPIHQKLQTAEKQNPVSKAAKHLPLLLIVEDNAAVANFLQLCLGKYYRLEIATNGAQGIEKALELVPDIILTDVAMPQKTGFELTSYLKNDLRTSHIPIVMLTAKIEHRDRLEGQRRGANAYITKPFEEQELLLCLQNLLHLQQQWKNRYVKFTTIAELPKTELNTEDVQVEDIFIQRLQAVFEENHHDESFNLERLCRILGMSSSQLDRKLKVLTDQSPMQMLRRFRLQKAYDLLRNSPKMSIKDVCYRTGFKSPQHFSRAFSEAFGKPPSAV